MMDKEAWTFKNIFQRQTKLAAYIIICATLVVIGASYALFFQVDSNTNNQIVEAGDLTFTYSNETVINNSICFEPMSLDEANLYASSCSYQLSIRNTGSLIADYNLFLVPREDNTADLSNLKIIIRQNGTQLSGYPKGVVSGEGDATHVGTTSAFLTGSINPSETILYSAQIYVDDTTNFQGSENKKVSFDIRGALKASDTNPLNSQRPSDATLSELQALNSSLVVTPSTSSNPNFARVAPQTSAGVTYDADHGLAYLANGTDTYVTYASDFTYDEATGQYTLTNYTTCQYSSCYNELISKYIILNEDWTYGSSENTAIIQSSSFLNNEVDKVNTADSEGKLGVTVYNGSELNEVKNSTWAPQTSGVFELEDDYGTSYYFRGDVTNNYVKFGTWQTDWYNANNYGQFTTLAACESTAGSGNCTKYASAGDDMYWRIVRINGDGTIRMIYDGTSAHGKEDVDDGATLFRSIGLSLFNETHNTDNAYVGYMYGTAGSDNYNDAHANINNSTIKTRLDSWYQSQMTNYASYIADAIFCNDRSVGSDDGVEYATNNYGETFGKLGYGTNTTLYGAESRLIEEIGLGKGNKATLKCPNKNDAFTVSDTKHGNGALTYPVGLLTIDEANIAGGVWANNYNYYLTTGNGYWTGSPNVFYVGYATVKSVDYGGYVIDDGVRSAGGVRPVINLKSDSLKSGSGTISSPYEVE